MPKNNNQEICAVKEKKTQHELEKEAKHSILCRCIKILLVT